jgi:anti-anti-sigma factor
MVMDFEITCQSISADTVIVTCVGDNGVYTAPRLREVIIALVDSGKSRIVLDFAGLELMDSTGLGVLVGALKRTRALGGGLFIASVPKRVLKIFVITGLIKVFRFYDSVSAALADASKSSIEPTETVDLNVELDELGWHWFPARIYTSETSAGIAVQESLLRLVDAFAMEVPYESDVKHSSWFREYILRMKDSTALPTRDEVLSLLQRALEQQTLEIPQAQIDVTQSQAVAMLLTALDKTPNAVVQVGSVLVIKVRDTTIVRNLTQLELAHWERNPSLFRDPEKALNELQQAAEHTEPHEYSE